MPYPTIGEYKDAIRLAEHSFGSLTHLRPEYDDTGDLHFSSGNFAVVFKMRDTRTDRPVAVKCFLREQPLRNQRYAQISQCLDTLPYNPSLLSYTYHPAEIWVETALSEQREFEVVTLDWVEGQTLSNYLQRYCKAGDTVALQKVAEAFDRLAIWLLEQPFAHGDLKPDNILVTPRGGLVLVDYDGMFTPDMAGKEATELGSPAFRHPYRSSTHFGKYIDHVPILVLSLSLHVLVEHPDWLETYYQGDNLILTANDLSKPDSLIFHTIRTECSAWTTQNRLLGLVNALILPISAAISITYLRAISDYIVASKDVKSFMISSGFVSVVNKVRRDTNNYPYVTFIDDKNTATNVYFSKNAAKLVREGQAIGKGFFDPFRIVEIKNVAGEKCTKLVGMSEELRESIDDLF